MKNTKEALVMLICFSRGDPSKTLPNDHNNVKPALY
jgi:hypothetical protein